MKLNIIRKNSTKQLRQLLLIFYDPKDVEVKCLDFYNDYCPGRGDEVSTHRYTYKLIIAGKTYLYDGWCYDEDIDKIPVGIFSHWLLTTHKVYDGPSTAWYTMFVGRGNIVQVN